MVQQAQATARTTFELIARDRATGQFQKLSDATGILGRAMRGLGFALRSLNLGFALLSAGIGIAGAAIASLITTTTVVNFLAFERASRRARIQLQFLGLSAENARDMVRLLTTHMNRANATTLLQNAEVMTLIAEAGMALTEQLAPLVDKFSDLIQADPSQMMGAFLDTFMRQDPSRFLQIVAGVSDLSIPVTTLAALESGDFQPFLDWLENITSSETLTGVEKLSTSLGRLMELTRPTRETVSESAAIFVNVFVESLAAHLETAKSRLADILLIALAGVMATRGQGLGRMLGLGLTAGLGGLLLVNLETTLTSALKNPTTVAAVVGAAAVAGLAAGRGVVGGLVLVLGLQLLPGITSALEQLSTKEQVILASLGVGAAMGLATRRGFIDALAIGLTLETIARSMFEGESLLDSTVRVAWTLLGAVLGGVAAGPWGAVMGAALGQVAVDIESKLPRGPGIPWIELGHSLAGWFTEGFVDEQMAMVETWKKLGSDIGDFITGPLKDAITTTVDWITGQVNDVIATINSIPLIPDIPTLPVPVAPTPAPTPPPGRRVPVPRPRVSEFAHGGIVPGPQGRPQLAVVHGGETILSNRGSILVVQLVLDRKVIGQVAVDALHRTARFQAGMTPGAIGS